MSLLLKRWLAVGTAAAVSVLSFAPSAQAVPTAELSSSATAAANWVATHLPAKKDGAGAQLSAAMGLATTGQCSYAPALRTLKNRLEDQAAAYIKGNPGRAANLAIVALSLGENPKKFGKQNLVSAITKKLPDNGDIGNYPFSQALALIALQRAGATVPASMVTRLLEFQNKDGSFGGYEYPAGTWNYDPDSTALAIQALQAVGGQTAALDEAVAWAKDAQEADGSWENYSPVDSTGLLGSTLGGDQAADALAWLDTQKLADGSYSNERDGDASDRTATSEALYLLSGKTLVTTLLDISACPKNPPALPKATASCDGVWVVVDRGQGQTTTRCATKYTTGLVALKSAVLKPKTFATQYGPAVCRISSYPYTCDKTWGLGYWSYWQAELKDDGTWAAWGYASAGASTSTPTPGVAEGWRWVPTGVAGDAPSITAPKAYTTVPTVTIDGVAAVGETLTATVGTWAPVPAKSSVQWYRSGKAIKNADRATSYKLKKADKGKQITVRITASGGGYATVVIASAPTAKVTK